MNQASATTPDQIFGYDVYDGDGNNIGSVDNVWVDDATSDLEFIGVKTGWIFGKTHVIPTTEAQIEEGRITVPYLESQIKDAPTFPADHELSPTEENDVYNYYGMEQSVVRSPTALGDMNLQTETRAVGDSAQKEGVGADRNLDTANPSTTDTRH
jgi:sporulation protein YlmC with PRC-barrel domain